MGMPVKVLNPLGITKTHMDDGFMYNVSFVSKPGYMEYVRVYAHSAKQAAEIAAQAGYKPADRSWVSKFVG